MHTPPTPRPFHSFFSFEGCYLPACAEELDVPPTAAARHRTGQNPGSRAPRREMPRFARGRTQVLLRGTGHQTIVWPVLVSLWFPHPFKHVSSSGGLVFDFWRYRTADLFLSSKNKLKVPHSLWEMFVASLTGFEVGTAPRRSRGGMGVQDQFAQKRSNPAKAE